MVTKEQSRSIRRLIERLQPHCLINSRIGNGLGDYRIIEQKLMNEIDPKPWEACLTMGANWGYNKYDTVYKKPDMMIRNLTDVVSKGGNLLLNIGPNPQGSFPQQTEPGLNAFRQWIKTNGEAIYGTSPCILTVRPRPLPTEKRRGKRRVPRCRVRWYTRQCHSRFQIYCQRQPCLRYRTPRACR